MLVRLNRSELGRFDALALGLFLIGQSKGHHIVLPNLGFYGRDHHVQLIDQERLVAGVNYLDELPLHLKQACLLISDKEGHGALYDDAATLARLAGEMPGTEGFNTQVFHAMQ